MKGIMIILILIIILALGGVILAYIKTKDKNTGDLALWVQAIATGVLVLVTLLYVNEARLARKLQEEGFDKYISELQEARKQQLKPYIYAFFYWGGDTFGSKFLPLARKLRL